MTPRYPIYIPSKGRWEIQQTSTWLSTAGVPHFVIVEEQELANYEAHKTPLATLLVLDPLYRQIHETGDDLGDTKSYGAGPARNMAWDHALASGSEFHWNVDDNIRTFYRYNRNQQIRMADATGLWVMEEFVSRYTNIGLAGPQYFMFVARKELGYPPYVLNTRIYSCNLIRNDLPLRWRLRLNEDTDLSLRVLKAGWVTVQFNAFLQHKKPTQRMAGGYTDAFYREGTKYKSEVLVREHPDVARIAWRFGRWHHYVDYSGFTQELQRKPGLKVVEGVNEFGMALEMHDQATGMWIKVPDLFHPDKPLGDFQLEMTL